MNYQKNPTNYRNTEPTSIPRSLSICDLSKLYYDAPRNSLKSNFRHSVSFTDADQSECNSSKNSQVLCRVGLPKRSRKLRCSLSSISNRSAHIADGSSDAEAYTEEDSGCDELTWSTIDQEILMWHYVCHTGRPYWWSSESKNSRLKKLPFTLSNEPRRSWMQQIDDRPKNECNKTRRAISDSYLAGQGSPEDLAHLVAIQLLGSCFTLPPDHTGQLLPDYSSCGLNGPPNFPDPRLISSLRMHSYFRYSPCFGYQARNTSPVQFWNGVYDGLSPSSSASQLATGLHVPTNCISRFSPRQRRERRQFNSTEGSKNDCSQDSQQEELPDPVTKQYLNTTASHHRQGINDDNVRLMNRTYHLSQSRWRKQWLQTVRHDCAMQMPESCCGVQSSSRSPATNRRLQPVIRSEPHHIFVQPIKELVIKRWRTFRRRLGGSLNTPLPSSSYDYISTTSTSGRSSPTNSSDRKARRRRAQERGDIHSSADSTPHYNSPANEYPNPFGVDSANACPASQPVDPLAEAAALVLAEMKDREARDSKFTTPNPSTTTSTSDLLCEVNSALIEPTAPESGTKPKLITSPSALSYTNRIRKRQNRKSMLSEMQTAEDFAQIVGSEEASKEANEGSVPGTARNTLPSPKEEAGLDVDPVSRS